MVRVRVRVRVRVGLDGAPLLRAQQRGEGEAALSRGELAQRLMAARPTPGEGLGLGLGVGLG